MDGRSSSGSLARVNFCSPRWRDRERVGSPVLNYQGFDVFLGGNGGGGVRGRRAWYSKSTSRTTSRLAFCSFFYPTTALLNGIEPIMLCRVKRSGGSAQSSRFIRGIEPVMLSRVKTFRLRNRIEREKRNFNEIL